MGRLLRFSLIVIALGWAVGCGAGGGGQQRKRRRQSYYKSGDGDGGCFQRPVCLLAQRF
jgi:hypothetical protein